MELDRDTGASKGYGRVSYSREMEAAAAQSALDGTTIAGCGPRTNPGPSSNRNPNHPNPNPNCNEHPKTTPALKPYNRN